MRRFVFLAAVLAALPTFGVAAPRVVADLPVTQSLAALVMGDLGTPALLTPPGTDPHHAQLKPSQARGLGDAELVFWIGPGLTPWLAGPLETLAPQARVVALLDSPGTHLRDWAADAGDDGHDHADLSGHDHGDIDPHAWLAPENARAWLADMAAELAAADPANAETYRANAERARAGIDALTAELTETLAPARETRLIFAHDAMGYFTEAFGLTNAGAIAEGDAAAPGAARLSALRGRIEPAAMTCVFSEPQHSAAQVKALRAQFPGLGGGTLDPTGGEQVPGPGLYAATMRALAAAIVDCRTK